jgi:hypothetical protein
MRHASAARFTTIQHRLLDPPKSLLETVLKAVLGLRGTGPETKLDVPKLVKQANAKLSLDAAGVLGRDPSAPHLRKLLGAPS